MKANQDKATLEMIKAWDNVFSTRNPGADYPRTLAFHYPFAARIEATMLMYPLDGYYLTESQFTALKKAISATSDTVYYISTYEDEEDFLSSSLVRGDSRHYTLSQKDDYSGYRGAVPWPLEYALYGEAGDWGAIISHEQHCILGGSEQMIAEVKKHYGLGEEDKRAFLAYWDGKDDPSWARHILTKIRT